MKTLCHCINQVKATRALALDSFLLHSPGVSAIFDENLIAARAVIAGTPREMRNGITSYEYMAGFGAQLGMSAIEFSRWIVAENRKKTQLCYEIEQEHLRLVYSALPTADDDERAVLVEQYEKFCEERTGEKHNGQK